VEAHHDPPAPPVRAPYPWCCRGRRNGCRDGRRSRCGCRLRRRGQGGPAGRRGRRRCRRRPGRRTGDRREGEGRQEDRQEEARQEGPGVGQAGHQVHADRELRAGWRHVVRQALRPGLRRADRQRRSRRPAPASSSRRGPNGGGDGPAYGNAIVIKHNNGKYSQYAHLSKINVNVGAKVKTGQNIAKSGNTGNSSGPHLHFEIRTTPNYGSALNPMAFLRSAGVNL
ncbi:LOW QUALITY PROTEIN: peptidase, partial [Streptomyces pristinaespiralis ATCC 25486]